VLATPLGPGPEFDRIRAIALALGADAADLGDDCALLPVDGRTLALSIDASVEGVHFRRDWLSLEEIGWRGAAGALSDLAAAGAEPIGVLVALTLPRASPPGEEVEVMRGVAAVCRQVGGKVLGGDLTGGAGLGLTVSVLGWAGRPMRRRGARPGDGVWVSGTLGGARAALAAWSAGRAPAPASRAAFARPEPRIAAGRWLAGAGATAMIDLSDGLAGDAAHLAVASGVGLEIELERLPLGPGVLEAASAAGEPGPAFAARGGEDYELLVTLPAAAATRGSPTPLTRIGTVVPGSAARLTLEGRPLSLASFDHFA
jgi:thiamine-monophosphate kinase